MMAIDMTMVMAPVMWGVAGALIVSVAGMVAAFDRNELPRFSLRGLRRVLPGARMLERPGMPAVANGF